MDENRVGFGSVHIHKEALADISLSAISEIEGVHLIPDGIVDRLLRFLGKNNYAGIIVRISKEGQITIEVKIQVRYGINIPEIAARVQETIKTAIEKMADVEVKDVHVNIQGIERGVS